MPTTYTEIVVSTGPGIMPVHVVVPCMSAGPDPDPADSDDVAMFLWEGFAKLRGDNYPKSLYMYDAELVTRERFLEWAESA